MVRLNRRWCVETAQVAGCPAVLAEQKESLILLGTSGGDVLALDGAGGERWRTPVGAKVSAWPVVDELPGAGLSVFAVDETGRVVCLSPSGEIRWQAELEAEVSPFNSVGVVRGGDSTAVVLTDRKGRATGLSADGRIIWQFHTHERGVGPAAVGDLDGNGRDEIVFCAGDRYVYCLNPDGTVRWTVRTDHTAEFSGPVMADLGAGPCVLAGSADDLVRCIGPDGTVRWKCRGVGAGGVEVGLSVGDINGDGVKELVYVHAGRAIQAVNGWGDMLWSSMASGDGDQPFGPSIGDIDGDGKPELLLTQRSGRTLRVLNANGIQQEAYDLPGTMVGAPVIADVDGDGRLEVLVVNHAGGALTCYEAQGPAAPGAVTWPTSRGAFDGRANLLPKVSPAKARPETAPGKAAPKRSETGLHLGMNALRYRAEEEHGQGASVEVSLAGPDHIIHRGVSREDSPVQLEIIEPGEYRVEAVLIAEPTGERLGRSEEVCAVGLFTGERAEAERLLGDLRALMGTGGVGEIGRIVRTRRREWLDLEERIAAYGSSSKAERRTLIAEVNDMVARLRREVTCQRMRSARIAETNRPVEFLPWQPEHPWTAFAPEADTPHQGLLAELALATDGRGHEATVIQLANLLGAPLDVRAWFDPMTDGEGKTFPADSHLPLRQVTWVPTSSGKMGADALPDLGDAGIVSIAPSSSARLWIDMITADLSPETYRTTLHLRALTPAGATWDIPVTWTVSPLTLPKAMPVRFCNWGYPESSPVRMIEEATIRDMQAHHTNVFVISGRLPSATYDAEGRLVGDIRWERHDWILDRLRPQDMILLSPGGLGPAQGAPGYRSAAWERAFAEYLPRWVKHLASKRFGYERWAFYPVDEPGLAGGRLIDDLEYFARLFKRIDPKVQVYTDPFKGMTVADLKRVLDVVDIFQPNFGTVLTEPSRERINYLKTTGKTLWTYEAAGGVKDMVGVKYYWEMIWTAWEIGLTGIGYWSYCTRGSDLWQGPNPNNNDWEMIYQGATKPVPSVRVQAIRIGIEDYARLWLLREAISAARKKGRSADADRAEERMTEIVAQARAALWNPALLAAFRREIVALTLGVR